MQSDAHRCLSQLVLGHDGGTQEEVRGPAASPKPTDFPSSLTATHAGFVNPPTQCCPLFSEDSPHWLPQESLQVAKMTSSSNLHNYIFNDMHLTAMDVEEKRR